MVKIDSKVYEQYVGMYEWEKDTKIQISVHTEWLYFKVANQPKVKLLPLSETNFFVARAEMEVEFVVSDDSRVNEMIIIAGGMSRTIRLPSEQ
jgi:Domain of unknown function (DUF3471)